VWLGSIVEKIDVAGCDIFALLYGTRLSSAVEKHFFGVNLNIGHAIATCFSGAV
jgi:hypothetical protein